MPCVKTIVKESCNYELACLKKKKNKKEKRRRRIRRGKEEEHFRHLATFWFGTFLMMFRATRNPVGNETLEDK